jgi:hypothetical protein
MILNKLIALDKMLANLRVLFILNINPFMVDNAKLIHFIFDLIFFKHIAIHYCKHRSYFKQVYDLRFQRSNASQV